MKRMPYSRAYSMAGQVMENAKNCTDCRSCVEKCPYKLNIPELIGNRLIMWDRYVEENTANM